MKKWKSEKMKKWKNEKNEKNEKMKRWKNNFKITKTKPKPPKKIFKKEIKRWFMNQIQIEWNETINEWIWKKSLNLSPGAYLPSLLPHLPP